MNELVIHIDRFGRVVSMEYKPIITYYGVTLDGDKTQEYEDRNRVDIEAKYNGWFNQCKTYSVIEVTRTEKICGIVVTNSGPSYFDRVKLGAEII